jgi:4-hydroxy 2-oxovalerate aldolase
LAIANSLCAVESGSTWLDCTVAGMGRGAGNASTEQLLPVVESRCSGHAQYQLQHLIVKHFSPLKQNHGWGDSLFYQIGATNGIHPTFVQEALSDNSLSSAEALNWISRIPNNSANFSRSILESARQFTSTRDISRHVEMETRA